MATLEQWQNRETARSFYNTIPDIKIIQEIDQCLNHMPIQVTSKNKKNPNFAILRLGPNDTDIKELLVRKVFFVTEPLEYFTAIYDAPYVYLFLEALIDGQPVERTDDVIHRNMGVVCGGLITEAIGRGLDAGSFACAQATWDYPEYRPLTTHKKLYKILNQRFAKQIAALKNAHGENFGLGSVMMAVSVGYAKPLLPRGSRVLERHPILGVPYVNFGKNPNKAQPFHIAAE